MSDETESVSNSTPENNSKGMDSKISKKKNKAGFIKKPQKKQTSISSWKKLKKVFLPYAFIVPIIAAISIYGYLQRIGWPELLLPSLGSYQGLAIIVTALVVVFIFCITTFYYGGYWIHVAAHSYNKPEIPPKKLWLLVAGIHIFWNIEFIFICYGDKWQFEKETSIYKQVVIWFSQHALLSVLFLILVAIPSSILFHRRLPANIETKTEAKTQTAISKDKAGEIKSVLGEKFWWVTFCNIQRGINLALASLFSSVGLLTFFLMNPSVGTKEFSTQILAVLLILTWPGIIAGIFYLLPYGKNGNERPGLRAVGILVAGISFVICIFFPGSTIVPINFLSLSAVSVYSLEQHSYVLTKTEMKPLYQLAGFDLSDGVLPAFSAYERFHMGNVLLLCKFRYNPLFASTEKVEEKTPTAKLVDADKALLRHGCVDVGKDEVRRVDPA